VRIYIPKLDRFDRYIHIWVLCIYCIRVKYNNMYVCNIITRNRRWKRRRNNISVCVSARARVYNVIAITYERRRDIKEPSAWRKRRDTNSFAPPSMRVTLLYIYYLLIFFSFYTHIFFFCPLGITRIADK